MDVQWLFHAPYNPQAAGMIERYNGLLKQGLRVSKHPPMMCDWASCRWDVLRVLNERPQKGGPTPVEALLHRTAAPIQLQVTTSETLLKPGYGRNGNMLLPAPTCLKAGEWQQWTWPWQVKSPHCRWLGLIAPWGAGLTHDLQVMPGVVAEWPPQVTGVYRGPDTGMILWEPMCSRYGLLWGPLFCYMLKLCKGPQALP
ncbi:hypothetical protein mRhiFer1_009894 [Rhinolophus ferrumequinum]|uniref:Integrase catalytic domain-containing protein n=1 Tax=Rhinolophus ferrumequinum TaxID=59479 RepID=A0A7J7YSH8_RHIFE|nr:hypothetical protein mRhiFer1_009894 [Rhinolophus ferrumequinum]